jgi:Serine acetyltransferase
VTRKLLEEKGIDLHFMTISGDMKLYYASVSITQMFGGVNKLFSLLYRFRKKRIGVLCGFSIPNNCVGKGLCLPHIGSVIISEHAQIGDNCRIHVGVNIGADARISDAAPQIENNVYIGPGAKLFGAIEIADNIAIGANAVVNKSFVEKGISIGGVPAKKISEIGTVGILL